MSMCPECFLAGGGHRSGCPNAPDETESCSACDETGWVEADDYCRRCTEDPERPMCEQPCPECEGKGYLDGSEVEARRRDARDEELERRADERRDEILRERGR